MIGINKLDFSIDKDDSLSSKREASVFLKILKKEMKKHKIKAEAFIGGSFAKGTMIQSDNYDIDIFVRFPQDSDIHSSMEKLSRALLSEGINCKKIHGSRDYLQVEKGHNLTFEIIPVIKINNPKKAQNTTDLSYFHVSYVKNKLNNNLIKEIGIAKKFFKAQKVYGAESYIQGFSGYSVECLIIHYKSFLKMINAFASAKNKIIIDPEKQYGKNQNILLEMNESKTFSPIILVDPTYKERNVLAALSQETFDKLKVSIKNYLKNPSMKYFDVKNIDETDFAKLAKAKNASYLHLRLFTSKQPGDIAGTKMKKFSRFITIQLSSSFSLIKEDFEYKMEDSADLHLILKNKNEIIRKGPPILMKDNVAKFKKVNKNTFVKGNFIYAKVPVKSNPKAWISEFKSKNSAQIKSMGISRIDVIN